MLKEHETLFRRLLIVSDALIVIIAFFASYHLKAPVENFFPALRTGWFPISVYLDLLPWLVGVWIGSLYFLGAYQSFRTKKLLEIVSDLLRGLALAFLAFGTVVFILKFFYLSRTFTAIVFIMIFIMLAGSRFALITTLSFFRKRGYNYREVLIVGTGKRAQSFLSLVKKHPEWGFRIAGLIDSHPELIGKEVQGHKIIGTLEAIPDVLESTVIDDVIFLVPRSWLGKMEQAVLYCESLGKRVSIAVDLFDMKFAKVKQNDIYHFPFLTFETTSDKLTQLLLKRLLDLSLAAMGLLVLMPILIPVAILIKITSAGPIFFKQKRVTLNGRVFNLYKFRTMVTDAEAQLEKLRQHNEMGGPAFKMQNDPRITAIGKWLRKFSIDEFPQFFNVLKGDMSLIGPRPPIPSEVNQYEPWHRRRLSMLPGISGLWQVSGRNKISDFDSWMKLDLTYIDTWSLWLDLKIFFKTIPVVVFGVGAK